MADMMQKREALEAFCRAVLERHREGVRSSTRYRRQTEPYTNRLQRVLVMGEPCYYLEVLHAGSQALELNTRGHAARVRHTFQVSLWLQYADADAYEESSAAAWDQMTEGTDPELPGLLPALRSAAYQPSASTLVLFGQPAEVSPEEAVPLDNTAAEVAHFTTFKIDVDD